MCTLLLFLHPYQTLLKWPRFPTGSSSSSSHLAKFSAFRRKFEMRVHFWKTDPTSTHAFLNGGWPGAFQMHFCLLLKAGGGF